MDSIVQIDLIQGEDFDLSISWEDEDGNAVDITGYTAAMQFRKNAGDSKIYLEASTENGKISTDTINNVMILNIPALEINELNVNSLDADLFVLSPDNKPYKLFSARANVIKRITR